MLLNNFLTSLLWSVFTWGPSLPVHKAHSLPVLPHQHPVVRNALFCLDSAWKSAKEGSQGSHVYTKALLAYAFALAGNQERRTEVLMSLDKEAVKEGESSPGNFLPSHVLGIKNSTPKVSHDSL